MIACITKYSGLGVHNDFNDGILSASKNQPFTMPELKGIIDPMLLRRMGRAERMAAACCLKLKQEKECFGIIVASGLSCFDQSINFTLEYVDGKKGILPPTSFVQSTDNMIAGQLSLLLKNNNYNITHYHKGVSFENALIDAIMLANECAGPILVGGVDELPSVFNKHSDNHEVLGEGAAFFEISSTGPNPLAFIKAVSVVENSNRFISEIIYSFLHSHNLELPDLILFGNSGSATLNKLSLNETATICYSAQCGVYFTNSSYALQLAIELMNTNNNWNSNTVLNKILILNNYMNRKTGFTYVQKHA